ncbi:MAG: crossover junction endodeoxyribonuclease RuvC [Candidatus Sungbacteria bacterium]|uniref:Crossover junction endodeoxyribonuclease RuvC n=1 Tax=Candidatus Sungiibacteriota bacterium TaxID=2750080 RepID=A0A9D6LSQ3_9BACT|nr:crossover junction endodeoxyribonuclease RuvC [Candidatus Sungbacteria bacterium]
MDEHGRRLKRVLGVDPGTTRVGYAVLEGAKNHSVVASGVFTERGTNPAHQLFLLHKRLRGVIRRTKPEAIAIEKLFFSKNVKTALAVAEARGIILLTAEMSNLRVYEYTPQEIKIALTSRGNADKKQVAAMIRLLLHLSRLPKLDDETDAMAIALTALVSQPI